MMTSTRSATSAGPTSPFGGTTHLAEHLLLRSIGNPFDHSNGTTEVKP
jgi:hypothetical protein